AFRRQSVPAGLTHSLSPQVARNQAGQLALPLQPLRHRRSRAAQTLRISWPGWCVPDALLAFDDTRAIPPYSSISTPDCGRSLNRPQWLGSAGLAPRASRVQSDDNRLRLTVN